MSANPHPPKRARSDTNPAPNPSHRPASQNAHAPLPQSTGFAHARFATPLARPPPCLAQQQSPLQHNVPTNPPHPGASQTHSWPVAAPATVFRHVSTVPAGWGPMGIPDSMTMTLHEALEILDPFEKTPHDLYSILAYASVAHPDVGEMLDRFARRHREATIAELERIHEYSEAAKAAQLAAAQAGLVDPDLAERSAQALARLEKPQGLIEVEEKARLLREEELAAAKRKQANLAKRNEARRLASGRVKTALATTTKPGQDKDFAFLVRRAEEELGWTGKYDHEKDPKPKYSRAALRKEASFWYNKATDVRDNLKWMQKQLIKELDVKDASFGTKRNATIASMGILQAIVTDKTEIGQNLREFWLDSLAANFTKNDINIVNRERKMLREWNPAGTLVTDLKKMIRELKTKNTNPVEVESALLLLDPEAEGLSRSAGNESEDVEVSTGSDDEEESDAEDASSAGEVDIPDDDGDEEAEEGDDAEGEDENGDEEQEEESSEENDVESDEESE